MSKGHPNDFTLKVCGQEEYLIGDYPLIQFSYIQDCLAKDIVPTLVTLSRDSVSVDQENTAENVEPDTLQRTRPSFSTLTPRKKGKHISAWKIEEPFVFTVNAISRLNCDAAHRTVEVQIVLHCLVIGKRDSSSKTNLGESRFFSKRFFSSFLSRLYRLAFKLVSFMVESHCVKARRLEKLLSVRTVAASGKSH